MMKELRFALYATKKNIQGSAELRTSFLTNIAGMAINNTAFIIIWVFFVKSVGVVNGWTSADIIGLLGFGTLSFGVVFSAAAGIRKLADYVANGRFDHFMLSPKNLLVRIATSSFNASGVGDIIFGIACLTTYALLIHASIYQVLLIVLLIAISTIMFLSIAVAIYSVSFLFTDANPVTSGLFELFFTPSIFHGGAFHGVTRVIFTFIVPSLVVGALPVEIVRNISLEKLLLVSVLSFVWFFVSLKLFSMGVKKYESSNFMTFGG
ncbi:MAG: ABC-2 family transporter protein [Candidatus Azambacteria bacterium]|nr:ABC-2 family transporter protein [Candidatus Azambacteria bacterium]